MSSAEAVIRTVLSDQNAHTLVADGGLFTVRNTTVFVCVLASAGEELSPRCRY